MLIIISTVVRLIDIEVIPANFDNILNKSNNVETYGGNAWKVNGSIRYDTLFIWPIYQMLKTVSPRLSLEHFSRLQW